MNLRARHPWIAVIAAAALLVGSIATGRSPCSCGTCGALPGKVAQADASCCATKCCDQDQCACSAASACCATTPDQATATGGACSCVSSAAPLAPAPAKLTWQPDHATFAPLAESVIYQADMFGSFDEAVVSVPPDHPPLRVLYSNWRN